MRRRDGLVLSGAVVLVAACMVAHATWPPPAVRDPSPVGRVPRIRPEYAGIVIPPNIAPLNFTVLEPGRRYVVRIQGPAGPAVEVRADSPRIVIPPRPWRRLLQANRGRTLTLDVYAQDDAGQWRRYQPITQEVAGEEIDPYLVYRLIRPLYNLWAKTGLYQRSLSSHEESLVVHGRQFRNGCVNCHTFCNHRPEKMVVHIRGSAGAAMLVGAGGRITKVDTRTKYNATPASYVCWHPSGKFVTFSANRLKLFMHAVGETRDVFDTGSDLGCYVLSDKAVKSTRHVTRPEQLETFPSWSPDGKWLYYCSAPKVSIERYHDVRYDLMRIAYDPKADAWGSPERVLSAGQVGGSITEPRVSPDGRYVMFCVADYGSFPIFQPSSDLHLLDVHTGRHRKLEVNSDRCDSWHCWSSNGRWFVFSSKRRDGVFAKPHFSYFDTDGKAHRPFVLPQEDPDYYESFLMTYNVPELIREPVPYGPRDFARAILADQGAVTADAVSRATQKAGDRRKRTGPVPGRTYR